jgi:hypothetical protein
MYFKIPVLIIILSLTLGSCTTRQQKSSQGCPIKQYDTSKLLAGKLSYEAPQAWTKTAPTNEMRLDEYLIDSATNTVASVYFFEGMRDALEPNLMRWKNQFKDDAVRQILQKKQYNRRDLPITIYHLTGTYLEKLNPMDPGSAVTEIKDYALLAAVVEMKKGTWFFKVLGPKAAVDAARNSFDELVDSFEQIRP